MKPLAFFKNSLIPLSFVLLTACGGGSDEPQQSGDPDEALTSGISFSNGTLKNGAPPAATNNPGDPFFISAS
jgi:hypothetical protein